MKIPYVIKKFGDTQAAVIANANRLLVDYSRQGFVLTLRQIYYRFVALDLFPDDRKWVVRNKRWARSSRGTKNAEPNYKWLGQLLGEARLAGLVDWDMMEDRMRALADLEHFDGGEDVLKKAASWYHVDMWARQKYRPEVWIEKDALSGVIAGVCRENDVPYFCCRGYTSLSEMWRASMRLRDHLENGYLPYIIHFGDHDPSGVDMSRDIFDRLTKTFLADCEFHRVALNMDQINEFNPPPNPVKTTDSRHGVYIAKYGEESWELDSLEPTQFRSMIEARIAPLRDEKQWAADLAEKARVKKTLEEVIKDWPSLEDNRRKLKDMEKVAKAANAAGWNGVTNSKLLWDFVSDLGKERNRLAAENVRLRAKQRKPRGGQRI